MSQLLSHYRMTFVTVQVWAVVAACGHSASLREPVAIVVAPRAVTSEQPPAPPPRAASSVDEDADTAPDDEHEYLPGLMYEHFVITLQARQAVIKGDLETPRAALRALAAYQYPAIVPVSWSANLVRLQRAAHETAETHDLDVAANGVAAMGRVCGDCHLETSGAADLGHLPAATSRMVSDTLALRMSLHNWAVERMWVGLTSPSDNAWNAGAAALVNAPVKMNDDRATRPADFNVSLDALRALGARALQAKSSESRAAVYGRALATCAKCHAAGAKVQ
jgi:hypothetical protein